MTSINVIFRVVKFFNEHYKIRKFIIKVDPDKYNRVKAALRGERKTTDQKKQKKKNDRSILFSVGVREGLVSFGLYRIEQLNSFINRRA